jgi:hypothetical protein
VWCWYRGRSYSRLSGNRESMLVRGCTQRCRAVYPIRTSSSACTDVDDIGGIVSLNGVVIEVDAGRRSILGGGSFGVLCKF